MWRHGLAKGCRASAQVWTEHMKALLRVEQLTVGSARVAHLCCSSLVPGKLRSMYCSAVNARSRPSTWCWLNVASLTCQPRATLKG